MGSGVAAWRILSAYEARDLPAFRAELDGAARLVSDCAAAPASEAERLELLGALARALRAGGGPAERLAQIGLLRHLARDVSGRWLPVAAQQVQ